MRATASGTIATSANLKLMARVDRLKHDPTAEMKQRLLSANKLKGMNPAPIDWKRRISPNLDDRAPFEVPIPDENHNTVNADTQEPAVDLKPRIKEVKKKPVKTDT